MWVSLQVVRTDISCLFLNGPCRFSHLHCFFWGADWILWRLTHESMRNLMLGLKLIGFYVRIWIMQVKDYKGEKIIYAWGTSISFRIAFYEVIGYLHSHQKKRTCRLSHRNSVTFYFWYKSPYIGNRRKSDTLYYTTMLKYVNNQG